MSRLRWAVSSQEELWIIGCHKFFSDHGVWDWYLIPEEQALIEIMVTAKGGLNPVDLKQRIRMLYASVGVNNEN